MPIPDPQPNGEPTPKPDEFEMTLEPVDQRELNLDPPLRAQPPDRPGKRGFGFWMGLVWCLAFLALTQGAPSFILMFFYGGAISERMTQIAREAKNDPAGGDVDAIYRKLLESREMRKMTQMALLIAPACGIAFAIIFIPYVVGKQWRRRLAFRLPHVEHVVLIVLLFLPLFVLNIAFEAITSRFARDLERFSLPGMKELMESMLTWPAWVVVLGIAVGPAISEELFCRGFLGHGLVRRYGTRTGVVLTSFFFGLIHLSLIQSVFAMAIGILLHSIYLMTRSLLAPILLHFLNNFFAIPAETESIPIYLGSSLQHAFELRPTLLIIAALLMAGTAMWALWASRVRIWSREGKEQFYLHVALPTAESGDRAMLGPIPLIVVGSLVVASGFFAAGWFGI